MSEKDEPFEPSVALYATGASQAFSDTVLDRFLTTIAVAIGSTVSEVGLIFGAKQLAINLPQVLFGQVADRFGKRKFIAAGRLLNSIALLALVFVDSPVLLLPLIVVESFFLAMITPSWGSLLGDYTSSDRRGALLGRINSVAQFGGLAAMIMSLILSLGQSGPISRESFTLLFLMAAASSLISCFTVLKTTEKPHKRSNVIFDIRKLLSDSLMWRFLAISFVFGLGSTTSTSLFSFITVGKLKMTVWQVASAATFNLACNVLSQRALGGIIDRLGRRPVIVFSRVAVCSSCFVYAFASSWVHIVLVEAFIGVALAAWSTGQATYVIDIAPSELRATYLAAGMTAVGISSFLGSYFGGVLFQIFLAGEGYSGISLGLVITGFLRVILGLFFLSIKETKRGQITQP